jgi:hypothetical protein
LRKALLKFTPRRIDKLSLVTWWRKNVSTQQLLFLMDVGRFGCVLIWVAALTFSYLDIGAYLRVPPTLADSLTSYQIKTLEGRLEEVQKQIVDINENEHKEQNTQALTLIKLTLIEERQILIVKRLDKNEAFWATLQEKFLWAVAGQIGVLFAWFLLGHDLKRRMQLANAEVYVHTKKKDTGDEDEQN